LQTSILNRYHHRESLIHHLDPRVKVVVTVLFIVSNSLLPDGAWLGFGISLAFIFVLVALARIRLGYVLKMSALVIPFALVAVTVLFATPGETWISFWLGRWQLTASYAGLIRFASIFLRSWLSVQMAILLAVTTEASDMLHALRHLGVPEILVAIASFMIRYLTVLAEEAGRLMRARDARSAGPTPGIAMVGWQAKTAGNMAGQLFLRSFERSERVYNAMLSRGFQGQFLTIHPHRVKMKDWMAAGFGIAFLVILQIVARLGNV
jgi:cobalt/nickel transport system permease protein